MIYSIGEVAKMIEVCPNSLRLWEEKGFIPQPHRRPTGRREYTNEDIKAIKEYLNTRYIGRI